VTSSTDTDVTDIADDIVAEIQTLASFTPQDVDTVKENDPTNPFSVDATQFMLSIVPNYAAPADGIDGMNDTTFFQVQPGTRVTFTVTFRNTIFPPQPSATVFKATIVVRGNHVARLDSRTVIIIVPPDDDWVWIG